MYRYSGVSRINPVHMITKSEKLAAMTLTGFRATKRPYASKEEARPVCTRSLPASSEHPVVIFVSQRSKSPTKCPTCVIL